MNPPTRLGDRSQPFWAIAGLALVVGIALLDVWTGYELAFSLFYLLPIALVTWFGGRRIGVATSVACALSWFVADAMAGHPYSTSVIAYWNTAIRFGVFLVVALLIAGLRVAHEHERALARTDSLTGAVNSRFFSELVHMEIDRSQRSGRPFTVAYVDLDNFKTVNDRSGHSTGDQVLCTTAASAKSQLRKVDIVARLGGDEFAFLLPETDQSEARVVIAKVQAGLLDEMRRNDWPVTFSIGVLTCVDLPATTDEMIRQVDELMYGVKNHGKNAVNYSLFVRPS